MDIDRIPHVLLCGSRTESEPFTVDFVVLHHYCESVNAVVSLRWGLWPPFKRSNFPSSFP